MIKDNLLEILKNNGDLNDVKPNSIMTLKEELREDLNHLPFVKSDIGKKILNCEHCIHCEPMQPKYQKYNFLEDDSVVFCVKQNCCTHIDDVCAMLTIDGCKYCGI
jgi:hypothetical protein